MSLAVAVLVVLYYFASMAKDLAAELDSHLFSASGSTALFGFLEEEANDGTLARMSTFALDGSVVLSTDEGTLNTGESYTSALYASESYQAVEYLLEGRYDTLTGRWGIDGNYINTDCNSSFLVYADGRCVYESPAITAGSAPCDVEVDLAGCNLMTILFKSADSSARLTGAKLQNRTGFKADPNALVPAQPGAWLSTCNLMQGSFSSGRSGHSVGGAVYTYTDEEVFATFYLDGEYESLSGDLFVDSSKPLYLEVYGDDVLLASSDPMVSGTMPFAVDLNGCERLTIRFLMEREGSSFGGGSILLEGARLSHYPL